MNNELRKKIINEALKSGVTNSPITFSKNLVNSYSGVARVVIDNKIYNVTGKQARVYGAICTVGYIEIKEPKIAVGLRNN